MPVEVVTFTEVACAVPGHHASNHPSAVVAVTSDPLDRSITAALSVPPMRPTTRVYGEPFRRVKCDAESSSPAPPNPKAGPRLPPLPGPPLADALLGGPLLPGPLLADALLGGPLLPGPLLPDALLVGPLPN